MKVLIKSAWVSDEFTKASAFHSFTPMPSPRRAIRFRYSSSARPSA